MQALLPASTCTFGHSCIIHILSLSMEHAVPDADVIEIQCIRHVCSKFKKSALARVHKHRVDVLESHHHAIVHGEGPCMRYWRNLRSRLTGAAMVSLLRSSTDQAVCKFPEDVPCQVQSRRRSRDLQIRNASQANLYTCLK